MLDALQTAQHGVVQGRIAARLETGRSLRQQAGAIGKVLQERELVIKPKKKNLIAGFNRLRKTPQGKDGPAPFAVHAFTHVNQETQTDRLLLAGIKIGNELRLAPFVDNKILGSQTVDILTVLISHRDSEELGGSWSPFLEMRRRNTLLTRKGLRLSDRWQFQDLGPGGGMALRGRGPGSLLRRWPRSLPPVTLQPACLIVCVLRGRERRSKQEMGEEETEKYARMFACALPHVDFPYGFPRLPYISPQYEPHAH